MASPFVNRKNVDCPLPNWGGYITLPIEVSSDDFATYWEIYKGQAETKDPRYDTILAWESRFHVVKDWKIDGLATEQITKDGSKMPSMKLMVWVVRELNKVIEDAFNLPNSPAPLNSTETRSETAQNS